MKRRRRVGSHSQSGLWPAPPDVLNALGAAIGADQVRSRATDRLAMGHDASHFLMTPTAVVTPTEPDQLRGLFGAARAANVPMTFRSGGTSLNGQAVTDGILVDTRRNFRRIDVLDDGARVRAEPGATVRAVNARLRPFERKLGPDPASEIACTIGGMVANNSSGMACGTVANTYHTLESMVVVLPSGTILDTGRSDADRQLRELEPDLYQGLVHLRDRVRRNPQSVGTITRLFAMKNTMGYGLNSLLDFDDPVDILAHLMVGSEGTLGFVASVVLRTVPLLGAAMTGLLVFDNLSRATASLPALVATGAATIELMDATSLRVGQRDPQADPLLTSIRVEQHAALLVEYQAESAAEVGEVAAAARSTLSDLPLAAAADLSANATTRAGLWHVRKGLYATVAGSRPSGSTALLEDIVVPVPALLGTCEALIELFAQHDYGDECVIFGHAKDGNVHFMLTERLAGGSSLDRFERFTEDLVKLVLDQGGSLKAEHGTGRMMAPYVRRQYGDELFEVMWRIKQLFDPGCLLNPDVVVTKDPTVHLRHLKSAPAVEPEVDRCVECGYCEPVCPSRDLTTTPRQRIALRREMQRARELEDHTLLAELEDEYRYDAVETCAVDGMCQTACPVLINTGDLVRRLRRQDANTLLDAGWKTAAQHWGATTRGAATALTAAKALPAPLVTGVTDVARQVVHRDVMPRWSADLPRGGRRRAGGQEKLSTTVPDAVFFAACVGTMFGPASDGPGSAHAFESLCHRAGIALIRPVNLPQLCCGTPWKSKGLAQGYGVMRRRVLPALWDASRHGALPIVVDASSCTEGLHQMSEYEAAEPAPEMTGIEPSRLRIVDCVSFVADLVLPKLTTVDRKLPSVVIHPTCSSTRMGTTDALLKIADFIADEVVVPVDWGCCGFAGDRGMLHPELTASATATEVASLANATSHSYASSNRTCELGLTRATGQPYQHILELLDKIAVAAVPGISTSTPAVGRDRSAAELSPPTGLPGHT